MATTVEMTKTLLTVDGLLALYRDGHEGELWEGEFVEVSPNGGPHGWVARRLHNAIDAHANRLGVGEAWGTEAGFILHLSADTIVGPDVSVVPAAYAASMSLDDEGFHDVLPLLVIEVKSPSDREPAMAKKLTMYLDAGIPEVWWVRPRQRTVTRHWPDRDPVVHGHGDAIDDVEALPGFSIAVDDLFPPE